MNRHTHAERLVVVLVLLSLAVPGCAGRMNRRMNSWIGHHQSELIQSWGPPTTVVSDGNGGSILIYGSHVDLGQSPGVASVDPYGNVRYTTPQQRGYSRTRMFYVDSRGIIYHWRWQGL